MTETIMYKGYEIEIFDCEWFESPRENDCNVGTMVGYCRNYTLYDEELKTAGRNGSIYEDFKEYLQNEGIDIGDCIYAPYNALIHSGVYLSLGQNMDRWDGGDVGYIYATKKHIREMYGIKKITKDVENRVMRDFKNEIKEFSDYINGYNMFGYRIEELNDSCSGYYGSDFEESGVLDEARHTIDYHIKHIKNQKQMKLKALVKNKAPLEVRIKELACVK